LLSQPDDWDRAQVVAENLTTGARRVLVESGRAGRITPTEHLVYAFGGTLYGQTFDSRAVAVTGGPIPLVSNVRATSSNITGGMFFDLTARGDLVYIEDRVEGRNRRLAWLDRIGRETPLPAEPQPFTHVRVSPDGRQIAVTLTRNATQSDVALYTVDRPGAERLTSAAKSEAPEWSPDGNWLYYFAMDPGSGNPDGIYRRRADLSTDPELVLATPDVPVQPHSVTADGRLLAITMFDRERLGIGIVSLDGAPALTRLSIQGSAEKPSISPDGRFIAYQVDKGSGVSVEVVEMASRRSVMVSAGLGHDPRWSPSGDEIVFRADDEMKSVRVLSAGALEFSTPVTLFRHPSEEFDVAHDGTFLVVLPERDEPLEARRQIQVVLNWFEELKAKVPK
jgi:Tol biopolymer transport system component